MRSTAWILRAVGVTKAGKVSLHGRPYQRASIVQRLRHSAGSAGVAWTG